jgi:hypothetical protein
MTMMTMMTMMTKTTFGLVMLAACSRTAEIGNGYSPVLQTFADPPNKLDILFVVDDSPSISDDQYALVAAARTELFPQLATMTGQPPDLHVGVVSTSVNIPGWIGLTWPPNADDVPPDGLLLIGPWTAGGRPCPGIGGTYLSDDGTTTNFTGTLEDNFACIASLGYNGSSNEEHLEAMRLGLSRPENAGFLRDDAMLLVVILTDEDDSSGLALSVLQDTADPLFLGQREYEYGIQCDQPLTSVVTATNCVPRPDTTLINPIEPYVDFLRGLKADPSLVMVAGITPPADPVIVIPDPIGLPHAVLDIGGACTPPDGPCMGDPTTTCPRDPVAAAVRLDAFLQQFSRSTWMRSAPAPRCRS